MRAATGASQLQQSPFFQAIRQKSRISVPARPVRSPSLKRHAPRDAWLTEQMIAVPSKRTNQLMKRTIIGVAIACVVLYVYGFLYWGMGPYKTMIWKHTRDDAAAGAALREYFPENGIYLVPGFANDDATMET